MKQNRIKSVCIILGVALFVVSCTGGKKESNESDIRVVAGEVVDEYGVVRMQSWTVKDTATINGKAYSYVITRTPADSLQKVKNESGDLFVDNVVQLRITRGTDKVFSKTFSKETFNTMIEAQFLKRAVLEAVVFDRVTPKGLRFVASVSYPQTDMYIPVVLTIGVDGKMSMARTNDMLEMEEE